MVSDWILSGKIGWILVCCRSWRRCFSASCIKQFLARWTKSHTLYEIISNLYKNRYESSQKVSQQTPKTSATSQLIYWSGMRALTPAANFNPWHRSSELHDFTKSEWCLRCSGHLRWTQVFGIRENLHLGLRKNLFGLAGKELKQYYSQSLVAARVSSAFSKQGRQHEQMAFARETAKRAVPWAIKCVLAAWFFTGQRCRKYSGISIQMDWETAAHDRH